MRSTNVRRTKGQCSTSSSCPVPPKIYTGTAPELHYPVTVALCDGHAEESRADGWTLVLRIDELPETD